MYSNDLRDVMRSWRQNLANSVTVPKTNVFSRGEMPLQSDLAIRITLAMCNL